jgi:hypothetical protein
MQAVSLDSTSPSHRIVIQENSQGEPCYNIHEMYVCMIINESGSTPSFEFPEIGHHSAYIHIETDIIYVKSCWKFSNKEKVRLKATGKTQPASLYENNMIRE